ncbi:hypothetical protein SCP_1500020 [Sparassis crispa]|uniref:Uncharacterized protein n=1 Tax=Sparassis crispa TaxID=139825 RepID=A0A401H3S8_9APHY|nr:hypothetical protein SCP_1500020 [Sparassis crispa]GBE89000.1 hypothetical protein SCP_1500020 [Sparassis crispa]
MSNDSASEPPSSVVSFGSYADLHTSASSSTSCSSVDFGYNPFTSYGLLLGSGNQVWHPPMLPPDQSPHFIHPPMLPPDQSPCFIHPPMLLPDESSSMFLHPPMLHQDDTDTIRAQLTT